MFGMSGTELAVVLVLALLLLGPNKLPELARTLGKGLREFKKSTEDLRSSVEGEFYRMDQPPAPAQQMPLPKPAVGAVAQGGAEVAPKPAAAPELIGASHSPNLPAAAALAANSATPATANAKPSEPAPAAAPSNTPTDPAAAKS